MVCGRVAQRIEEPPAAARVAPTFGIYALGIGAHVQEFRPRLIVQLGGLDRPRQVCLPAVGEFDFRAFTAVGADNEQHGGGPVQCATAAAAASSIKYPSRKRSMVNGALMGCGSSRAMVQAKTCADPGVALNPPVPQPQLTYRPGTGVLAMMGERSGVTSTMPPQLRSMRKRRKWGNNSQIASKVCVLMCSAPRWV